VDSRPTEPLLRRFEVAASEGPKLYHATRVVLSARPALPADGSHPPRWWSGVDPAVGWEAFLSAEQVFEAREYERRSRWHQSCYYGGRGRVNEYTLLAGEACGLLPLPFVIPASDYHRGILHLNRDVWTFFLYRLAAQNRAAFGLDIHGLPPYADFAFPGLEAVVACTTKDAEREEQMLIRFQEEYFRGRGRAPEFVFAGLRIDAFAASVLALQHLEEHKDELYGSPNAIHVLVSGDGTETAHPRGEPQDPKTGGGEKPKVARGQNDERDAWIYQQWVDGVPYDTILQEFSQRFKAARWAKLSTIQGVHQAAVRYANRKNLPHPPSRKG